MATHQANSAEAQFYTWIFYTVAAPVLVFAISWPIAWAMRLPHPFLATFGTADVLPLAALILLGAAADVENEAVFGGQRSAKLLKLKHFASLLAILSLAAYGALKAKGLMLLSEAAPKAADQTLLAQFSIVSIITLGLALACAYYVKMVLMQNQVAAPTSG